MELHRMGHRDTFTRICLVSIGARSIEGERGKGEGPLSGRRGGERLFAYPGDPPLLGNQRGDTVTTGYPVTLHYPRQRDGTLVLEKLCRTANTRIHRSCAHTIRYTRL